MESLSSRSDAETGLNASAKRLHNRLATAIDALAPAITGVFASIARSSVDQVGITRDAYGSRETAAGDILIEFARAQQLQAGYDRVGNLNVTAASVRSEGAAEILIGSHLDSVPCGGNYDGLAGVVAGIAVLSAMQQASIFPKAALRVLGFRGEESPWFGTAYLGSKLFLGLLTQSDIETLRRFDTCNTLAEHMRALGLDLSAVGKGPVRCLHRVKAYLELHIEQGPLLEAIGRPVGLATAIRGNIRYPFAKCFGRYAHSAAVPRHLRADALMATAKLVAFADDCWRALIDAGNDDLVFTCGIFHTNAAEQAMTKIPGEVTFSLNIGGISDEIMEQIHGSIMRQAEELATQHHVKFDFGPRIGTGAVALNKELLQIVGDAGNEVGIPPYLLPTVGHDAAMFARNGIPSSVILVRNTNSSHNPDEHMEMEDFMSALKVLGSAVLKLC
jgi:N-carbamoyl-L-amino-acid hydrolase